MNREKEIQEFLSRINSLESEYKIKIIPDNPDGDIMFFDEVNKEIYHKVNGTLEKW